MDHHDIARQDPLYARCSSAGSPHSTAPLPEVSVRILGAVDVIGAARPFERAWTLELVVFLALHPRGAATATWTTALWPDGIVADATRHSTVSAARRALGRASDGTHHLPRSSGRLQLAPSVTSDWARFSALASATGVGEESAWESALELVRGRPFDGLRSADWALFDGTRAAIEGAVVDVAMRLAERRIAAGDGRRAEHALRRALAVSPYDERLYRLLLRAADRQGNPAGVEAVMRELVSLLGSPLTGQPPRRDLARTDLDVVHPETAALYLSLRRRSQSTHRTVWPAGR